MAERGPQARRMTLVIDSSVAACWCLPDEASAVSELALSRIEAGEEACAPVLWWYEIRNVLVIGERKGRLGRADVSEFLDDLSWLKIGLISDQDSDLGMLLARRHRLTFYDSSYLALSLRMNATLASLDRALIAAARAEGIDVLA